ncbi:Os11g0163550 [Oryza sativa Japonica Group]|uniref:Os11g0163550 protein n=1 Tax=Oryza sativa subsp. japonica TaxID=39947 RepID=A0A0P0XZ34_ORYSJ|nr:Os11g0163550 [Oryza sativa Japonica Group]
MGNQWRWGNQAPRQRAKTARLQWIGSGRYSLLVENGNTGLGSQNFWKLVWISVGSIFFARKTPKFEIGSSRGTLGDASNTQNKPNVGLQFNGERPRSENAFACRPSLARLVESVLLPSGDAALCAAGRREVWRALPSPPHD